MKNLSEKFWTVKNVKSGEIYIGCSAKDRETSIENFFIDYEVEVDEGENVSILISINECKQESALSEYLTTIDLNNLSFENLLNLKNMIDVEYYSKLNQDPEAEELLCRYTKR